MNNQFRHQTSIIDHSDTSTPPSESDVFMELDQGSADIDQEELSTENTETQPASNSPVNPQIASSSTPLRRSSRKRIPTRIFFESVAQQDTTLDSVGPQTIFSLHITKFSVKITKKFRMI